MKIYEDSLNESEAVLREAIRRVVTTNDGKYFLHWLLTQELGLYSTVETEEHRILHNLAVRLMERIGAYHEYHGETITSFLVDLKPFTPEKERNE